MEITNIGEFIQIANSLPLEWKIIFIVVFFLMPKVVDALGGTAIIKGAIKIVWDL